MATLGLLSIPSYLPSLDNLKLIKVNQKKKEKDITTASFLESYLYLGNFSREKSQYTGLN